MGGRGVRGLIARIALVGIGAARRDSTPATPPDSHTETDTDADGDTDTDADGDTDTDADTDTDTSKRTYVRAYGYHDRMFTLVDGEWVAGLERYSWQTEGHDIVCQVIGTYGLLGDGPDGCPGCDWAFTVDVTEVAWSGDHCDTLSNEKGGGDWWRGGLDHWMKTAPYEVDAMSFGYAPEYDRWTQIVWATTVDWWSGQCSATLIDGVPSVYTYTYTYDDTVVCRHWDPYSPYWYS